MKITILTYGSRGDVQPYIALGKGLIGAGHAVRLAAPAIFEDFVRGHGLEFAPLAGNPAELVQALVEQSQTRGSMVGSVRAIMGYAMPLGMTIMRQCREACADADLIVHSFLLTVPGHEAAAARGISEVGAQPYPIFSSTGAFPNMMFPELPLGAWYNHLTHRFFSFAFWQGNRIGYQWMRRKHSDLPPLSGWPYRGKRPVPLLYGVSPQVIDPAGWPDHTHFTGYWILDSGEWQPPADLLAFLGAGSPPVYIGFGSTIGQGIEQAAQAAIEALRLTGQRGVMLGGWAGIRANVGHSIYLIDAAPHEWLFPRMAAVVHHGGAGTTAAGLRAGVPSIITPFSSDQPFWGRRVHQLGVGPAPIPYRKITAQRLADAIQQAISDQEMREQASRLGDALRSEDGVAQAINVIEAVALAY